MSTKGSLKRKLFWAGIFIVGLMLISVLIGSLYFFKYMIRQSDELLGSSNDREYDAYYVLITNDDETDFWKSILQGAKERALKDNIYLQIQQEELSERLTKQEQMEMAIHSGVDGILLDGDESSSLLTLVDQATAAGIPVVTIYHDCSPSSRISFVSISGTNMGRDYGEQICSLIEDRQDEPEEKVNVMVLLDASDSTGAQTTLITGIREEMEEHGMVDKAEIETALIPSDSMFSAQEEIRKLFSERKPSDIFVCLDELSTVCVSQLVVDYNLVGTTQILGFYNSEAINSALEKQIISATVTADTYQMGSDAVEALTEYRQTGYASDYYPADISVVTSR